MAPAEKIFLCISSTDISGTQGTDIVKKEV